ncbi:MAG TPA: HAMP domain-containing sensor histidine kinase [Planctomycetota bacterium]|nr:HAMP domain-containing sensor histidine kinase [Planctomycetota bacterium]
MRVDRDLAEERLAEASATRTRAAGAARLADADALLRAVSHDLRQPLRTALDHLALLRKRKAPALGDDGGELLAFAADSVRRAERILGDLLDVFRAERRGGVAASADPAAAIADAVANLARRKGRAPAPTVAGAPPRVAIPHPLLVQIFQNLLDNAARHGGDRMTTIDAVRSGALVRFSIVDRGAGVDARKFDRLLHGPRSGGLGLAICSRAVEGAGGRLWAEPTAAGGAAIVFELPAFKP